MKLSGVIRRLFRVAASLRLAVALIAVDTGVLAWATLIESRAGAPAARSGVYSTGWFLGLNVALAINVLAAVWIRFPWRLRQVGFVLTHVGVLVLLAGCLITQLGGIEAELPVFEGHAAHRAQIDSRRVITQPDAIELGFQVYLRRFRRKLDPGSGTASHYSSLVDFQDLSDPPRPLRENVLITLNAPVDFVDPKTGRSWRFFQASFRGPWKPGDAEFDQLAGSDRSRDQIYMSQLSVNYDPGRGTKYLGSFMIVVGMITTYCLRRPGFRATEGDAATCST